MGILIRNFKGVSPPTPPPTQQMRPVLDSDVPEGSNSKAVTEKGPRVRAGGKKKRRHIARSAEI